jgi:hypothetical protein
MTLPASATLGAEDRTPLVHPPCSPELALVDPDLAHRLRDQLPGPGRFRPASCLEPPVALPVVAAGAAPAAPVGSARSVRPRQAAPLLLGSLLLVLVAVLAAPSVRVLVAEPRPRTVPAEPSRPASARSEPRPDGRPAAEVTSENTTRGEAGTAPKTVRQVYTWAEHKGAVAYEVHVYAGSRRVLRRRTTTARFVLESPWRSGRRVHHLERGRYMWYVWPVRGDGRVEARPVVQTLLPAPW